MKRNLLVLLLLTAVIIVSSCGEHTVPVQTPEHYPEHVQIPSEAAVGGEMIYGTTESMVLPNPLFVSDVHTDFLSQQMFAGLLRVGQDLKMKPYVAESWKFSDDGRRWTFSLRDDVYFHDGNQLTAEDVEYTYSTILHQDYTGTHYPRYEVIDRVSAQDDFTVVFELSHPHAPLLSHLDMGILPKHIYGQHSTKELEDITDELPPVGAGPYQYEEKGDDHIVLKSNADFFLPGPFIENIRVQRFDDQQSMVMALEQGEIDYMSTIPTEHINRIKEHHSDRFNFYHRQHNGYSYLGLNQTDPILQDKKIRQAIMYAIDRRSIVKEVLDGKAEVINSHIPSFSWASNPELHDYQYNPQKAVQLLEDGGWSQIGDDDIRINTDGKRLRISCVAAAGNIRREQILERIKQDLAEVGFEFEIKLMEWDELFEKHLDTGKFQSYLLGWGLGIDPDPYLYFHSESGFGREGHLIGFNDVQFENERLDYLIEKGRQALTYEERTEIYHEVEEIINAELPYAFLYSKTLITAVDDRIKNVSISDIGPVRTELWYIETEDD